MIPGFQALRFRLGSGTQLGLAASATRDLHLTPTETVRCHPPASGLAVPVGVRVRAM